MKLLDIKTVDHDPIAGYGGRIGYRYLTVATVQFDAAALSKARKTKSLGGLVVDVANALYRTHGFTQTYCPSVNFSRVRARNGLATVTFEYYHNGEKEEDTPAYEGNWKQLHKPYEGKNSQIALESNND